MSSNQILGVVFIAMGFYNCVKTGQTMALSRYASRTENIVVIGLGILSMALMGWGAYLVSKG